MKVFVLGAGASFPAGFPLGRDLYRVLRASVTRSGRRGGCYGAILEAWQALEARGIFNRRDDFELNLTRLDTALRSTMAAASRREHIDTLDPVTMRRKMGKVVFDALLRIHRAVGKRPADAAYLSNFLARHVDDGDTIVTFNYDCLVEKALSAQGRWGLRFGYGLDLAPFYRALKREHRGHRRVEVLKLHGSLGWLFAIDRAVAGAHLGRPGELRELVIQRPVLALLGYEGLEFHDPTARVVGDSMALPSFIKGLTGFPLPHLWRRAEHLLRAAERVVIVGYSLPGADSAARAALLCVRSGVPLDFYWYGDVNVEHVRQFFEGAGVTLRERFASIEQLAAIDRLPLSTAAG